MIISSKTEFSEFAATVSKLLYHFHGFQIKPSKMRESLSRSAGFISHNQLLSKLPVEGTLWTSQNGIDDLSKELSTRYGFSGTDQLEGYLVHALKYSTGELIKKPSSSEPPHEMDDFVPISIPVFEEYARALAELLNLGKSASEEVLAKIYGYSSKQDVENVIQMDLPRGPFGISVFLTDIDGEWLQNCSHGKNVHRHNHVLWTLKDYFGAKDLSELSESQWKVVELGLFDLPERHRKCFELIRFERMVKSDSILGNKLSVSDYVRLDVRETGEAYLEFTQLGLAVFETCVDIVKDQNKDTTEIASSLEKIIDNHPANPWPKAILINYSLHPYYQGMWSDYVVPNRPYGYEAEFDCSPIKQYSKENAGWLFTYAESAISQFISILGDHRFSVPDSRMLSGKYYDHFYWPATLYAGGAIAMNLGFYKLAKRWLSWNYRIGKRGEFGSRYYLALLCFYEGKSNISKHFKKDQRDTWAHLALCVERANKGDLIQFRKYLAEALIDAWAVIDYFEPVSIRNKLRFETNHDTPALVEEFFWRLGKFERGASGVEMIKSACLNPVLRETVVKLHKEKTKWFLGDRDTRLLHYSPQRFQPLEKNVRDVLSKINV